MIAWNPCYEYRLSTADEVIAFVEFPAGMLVAPHGSSENVCNPATLRPVLRKLRNLMRLKARIVLLDCLLVLGIIVHWRPSSDFGSTVSASGRGSRGAGLFWPRPSQSQGSWGRQRLRKLEAIGAWRSDPCVDRIPGLGSAAPDVRCHGGAVGHPVRPESSCKWAQLIARDEISHLPHHRLWRFHVQLH